MQKISHSKKRLSEPDLDKKNTGANAKVYDLNQKTMQALGSLAFAHSAFEKAGEDLKEGASYDQVSEEFQDATEKVNEVQRVEEIAQEQLCNSRERHDADVLEMLIVKDAQRFADIAQEQVNDSRDRYDKD